MIMIICEVPQCSDSEMRVPRATLWFSKTLGDDRDNFQPLPS